MNDQLTEVYASIDALIDYALAHLDLDPRNADWTRNQIFALFRLDSYPGPKTTTSAASVSDVVQDIVGSRSQAPYGEKTPDPLLAAFRAAATTAGLFKPEEGPAYADTIMGILSANPADLDDRFLLVEHRDGGMAAMQWFYDYCVANNYVKRAQLDRNPRFDSHGLTVTINLAKPEFKNMKKAAAGNAVAGGYPKCTICHENEGFAGRDKRTLRTLPVTLGGESWFWQFSPYGYFDQHGICVNTDHTPMHVDRDTFGHLLDFVDRFPGYFLGCNAALPRIGGSVLAHDHYQGGGELLPMHKAATWPPSRSPTIRTPWSKSSTGPVPPCVWCRKTARASSTYPTSSARHGSVMTTRRTASPAMTRTATANPPSRPARSSPNVAMR